MLIGILLGIIIMVVLFLSVYLGYKLGHKQEVQIQTEQELEELKKRQEGFNNIFNYDQSVALGKRVNK